MVRFGPITAVRSALCLNHHHSSRNAVTDYFTATAFWNCSMSAAEDLKEIVKAKDSELHSETLRADAAEHRCGLLEDALRDRHAAGHSQHVSPSQHERPWAARAGTGCAWPGSPAQSSAPHTPHVPSTIPYGSVAQHSYVAETSQCPPPCSRSVAAENAKLKDEKNLLCIQLAVCSPQPILPMWPG